MRVVIAGGGTAGHVNPALALADALSGHSVSFIGTTTGAEARLVPAAGWHLDTIEVTGFDRARPLALLPTGVRALGAVRRAGAILRGADADVVVGMGGYVSLPATVAGRRRGLPVVIHEQNIVFGLANRVAKPFARSVAVSFRETLAKAGRRGVFVGNPVLPDLVRSDRAAARARAIERWELDPERTTILAFGGSQGAGRINAAALGLTRLWADRDDVQIVHITGTRGFVEPEAAAGEGALLYRSVDFVADMVDAYAVADLALCRGGATTVAELGVAGLPAVIVPYPHHRDRQQERHGRVVEAAGAGVVLLDPEADAERVSALLGELIADPDRLARMADAARALGRPDAAERLAHVVEEAAA